MELRRALFIYTKGPETGNLEETLQLGFPGKEGQKEMVIHQAEFQQMQRQAYGPEAVWHL